MAESSLSLAFWAEGVETEPQMCLAEGGNVGACRPVKPPPNLPQLGGGTVAEKATMFPLKRQRSQAANGLLPKLGRVREGFEV